jgi:hypothetical protein
MRPRLGLFSGTLLLMTLGVTTARPEPVHPPERVRISYVAPARCPDQAAFEAGVSERLSRPWKAEPGELARTIRVVVTEERGLLVARMAFTDAAGRLVSRAVSAERCEEVVSGMALVTALAIQSQVFGEQAAGSASAAPVASSPAEPPAPGAPMVASPPRQPPTSRPSPWAHDVGLRFGVADGLGPRLATGVGALWGVGPVTQPSFVRLSADWYDTRTVTVERAGGKARFQLFAGRLEVCPVRLVLARSLVLPACAGVEAGVLKAEGKGRDVVNPKTVRWPWAAAVLAPRVRLDLGHVFAELVAEERFPLVRQPFKFNRPERLVYEIPSVAFGAVAAVGLRFP